MSPEPVAPSPEEIAANEVLHICLCEATHPKRKAAIAAMLTAWRTRLYLAAKIEGLQESANVECDRCKAGIEVRNANGDWFHPDPVLQDFHFCDACPQVMDTLLKLREEAK